MVSATERFTLLVQRFVADELEAAQFADQAVEFWQQQYTYLQEDTRENEIIATLCLEADALTNDPPYATTPEALREAARQALHNLRELQTQHHP